MDIKTVRLGLLSFGEASANDIKNHFEVSFDHIFPSGFGSIDSALAALPEQGPAQCKSVSQRGRPYRKVYRITPAGEAALRRDDVLQLVQHNRRIIAAGSLQTEHGSFPVKMQGVFEDAVDLLDLPVKVQGERVVRLSTLR